MADKKHKRGPRAGKTQNEVGEGRRAPIAHTLDGDIDSQKKTRVLKMEWSAVLSMLFTGVVAAATVGLVITAAIQLNAVRTQIRQTEAIIEQMHLERRAWLTIETPIFDEEYHNSVIIPIRNVGATPATFDDDRAYLFRLEGVSAESKITAAVNAYANDPNGAGGTVAPSGTYELHASMEAYASDDDAAEPKIDYTTYVYVSIPYRDFLGGKHETTCCFVLGSDGKFRPHHRFQKMD